VFGCAAAYELARAGLDVTIVDRDGLASHSSGQNAGNLNALYGTPPALIPLTLEALRIHSDVRTELASLGCANYAMSPLKRVHLGCDDADRLELEATHALFNSVAGFSSTWLEPNELNGIEPQLASDFAFGIVTAGGLRIDSYEFSHSLAAGAIACGATVLREPVQLLTVSCDRVTGIQTSSRNFPCDEVVLATGPWIAQIKAWLGIELRIKPLKGELLLMQAPEAMAPYDFTWRTACLYRRRDNELWVGGNWDDCGFDSAPTENAKRALLDGAARIMPAIRHARLLDHIAALRPVSLSGEPIASRANGWDNVYIANGGGFKGVLLSVAIARRVRYLLLDKTATIQD
jgi:glycine oxidase